MSIFQIEVQCQYFFPHKYWFSIERQKRALNFFFIFILLNDIWLGGGGLGQSEKFAEDAERVQKPVSGWLQWERRHSTENIFQEYKAKCPSYFKEDEEKDKEKREDEEKDNKKDKEEKTEKQEKKDEKEKEEEKEERKVCKSWDFKEQLVFQRFDSFVERLKTIQDFCNTANQFLKLEKVWMVFMLKQATGSRWK